MSGQSIAILSSSSQSLPPPTDAPSRLVCEEHSDAAARTEIPSLSLVEAQGNAAVNADATAPEGANAEAGVSSGSPSMTEESRKAEGTGEAGKSPEATGAVSEAKALDLGLLRDQIIEAVKQVFDPEIPVNIYELGLIYKLDVESSGRVAVEMTLTAPACPAAGELPGEVEGKILSVEGVTAVHLQLVWEPPWSPELMSEDARLALGFF